MKTIEIIIKDVITSIYPAFVSGIIFSVLIMFVYNYSKEKGFKNVFVGTVEGYPKLTEVISVLKELNPSKVTLMPLMVVAGDHAINDMSSDEEDSWKSILEDKGFKVDFSLKGLGEYEDIRKIYIKHIKEAKLKI